MTDPQTNPASQRLRFHYEKAGLHRVVHCDGVYGGPSPSGQQLVLHFFSERRPIPKSVTAVFDPATGKVTDDATEKDQRDGVFREVETTAIMSLDVAQSLRKWLDQHIDTLEQLQAIAGKDGDDDGNGGHVE